MTLRCIESTDIGDRAALFIFIRMILVYYTSKEKLLNTISLKERTRGVYIVNVFKNFITNSKVPLVKLVSIILDDEFVDFLTYHCMIHQQMIANRRLNTRAIFFKVRSDRSVR